MNYTVIQEKTKGFPSHVYTLNEHGKLISYQKANTHEIIKFKSPLRFDLKGRQFNTIVPYDQKEKYITTATSCTCKGFVFRKKCKHTLELNK